MPEIQQKQKTPIFQCPACNARGQVRARSCSTCSGHGLYFYSLGRLFYWGKKITKKNIWQARITKTLNAIFIIILFFFALYGLYSFTTYIIEAIELGLLFQIFKIKDSRLLIFWLSIWVDLYLYYCIARTGIKDNIQKLKSRPTVFPPPSLEEALKLPKKSHVDISPFFSPPAHTLILNAFKAAKNFNHKETEPLHLLAASLTLDKTATIFGRLGISLKDVKTKISHAAISFYSDKRGVSNPRLSPNIKKIFFSAFLQARAKRKKQVDLFDLLIAINNSPSPAREVLYSLDIEKHELRNVVLWVETAKNLRVAAEKFGFLSRFKPRSGMNRAMTATATPFLNRFSSDLTLLAQKNFLAPCVARDDEFAKIFQVAEANKQGVLLIGNPGTGRRAIINGLARRLVTEEVPKVLQDKRLVSLSLQNLVSSSFSSASPDQKIAAILAEVVRSGNIALSISNIHNLAGVKAGSGELGLSQILASNISQGNFFFIATTTPTDYQKYIESLALDEVLEKIKIPEPKGNALIQILEVATIPIEAKNKTFFSYDAITQAAKLSDRYLHEKYLPKKAITILEQAAIFIRKERGQNTIIQKEDIARVVSGETKIPLTQITEKESDKLMHLEEAIHQKMIGQAPAVEAVANALRRARAKLRDIARPIASFLFLGPTGVGKTQLAKVVAETYFGSAKNMIRLDMSEYQEISSLTRLLGSGKEKITGRLTEPVRQNPFSLILLDELEKAHPEILNIFLQVSDDGRLTDGFGRVIDFTNTIIIATSNAGAKYIHAAIQKGESYDKIKNNLIENELKTVYRPEFLNRFDEIIVFKPLTQSDLNQITILLLSEVVRQMEAKGIKLEFTEPAVIELAKAGYDPEFGARPLRRVIQEKVTNTLAQYLIQDQVNRRDVIIYDVGGKITVNKAKRL